MPPPVKKGGVTAQLAEAVQHLERLVNYCIEWQTDWSAISTETKTGKPNPDFDKEYLVRLRDHPEEVYEPAVLAAREFLKSLKR